MRRLSAARMSWCAAALYRGLIASLLVLALPHAVRAQGAPTLTSPDDLRRLSAAVPVQEAWPRQVLLDESRYSFDEKGRLTRMWRFVYRVDTREPRQMGSTLVSSWSPWYQVRPLVQAQVITSDGTQHLLDQTTVVESAAGPAGDNTWADTRILSAPLPSVALGCIVEQLTVERDSAVALDAGITLDYIIGNDVPTRRQTVTLDAPDALPLKHRIELFQGMREERVRANGRTVTTLAADYVPVVQAAEDLMPWDLPRGPYIVLSSGTTWSRVANAYRALVEPRMTADPGHAAVVAFAAEVRSAAAASADRGALIEAARRAMHRRVRYTGVELGSAAIVPAHPSTVLERGYGDCKDKSLLLVAVLRELGIEAELGLLKSGPGRDVRQDLPGWRQFDHAIVHIPGKPDGWIDATDEYSRAGQLPTQDHDRHVLLIRADTRELSHLPPPPASETRLVEERTVSMSDTGGIRIVERSLPMGVLEAEYRREFGAVTAQKLTSSLEPYARDQYAATGTVSATATDGHDFTRSFEMTLTAEKSGRGTVGFAGADLSIPRVALFDRMPQTLFRFSADSLELPGYSRVRRAPMVLHGSAAVEWRYVITPPAGFVPDSLPEPVDIAMGPCRYRQSFAIEEAGRVVGRLEFDPRVNRMTPEEVAAFRKAYAELMSVPIPQLDFRHAALGEVESGDMVAGLRALRAQADAPGAGARERLRLATGMLKAGLGTAACAEARAVARDKSVDARTLRICGEILSHDMVGRLRGAGYDREGAIAVYRRAKALEPRNVRNLGALAAALEYDAAGDRYTTGADLLEARELYEAADSDELSDLGMSANLPALLMAMQQWDAVLKWSEGYQGSSVAAYRLAAIANGRGADAALAEARRTSMTDEQRSDGLAFAALSLIRSERYAEGAKLFQASSRGRDNAAAVIAQAQVYARMKPYKAELDDKEDPASTVRAMFDYVTRSPIASKELEALMAEGSRRKQNSLESMALLNELAPTMRRVAALSGFTPSAMRDVIVGSFEFHPEGDPAHGVRLRLTGLSMSATAYLVREGGRWRLVGMNEGGLTAELGAQVLASVKRNDLDGARQWLGWMDDEQRTASFTDSSAYRYWRTGSVAGTPEGMRLAAATIMSDADSVMALAALEAMRSIPMPADPSARRARLEAKTLAFSNSAQWDSTVASARALREIAPNSPVAMACMVTALGGKQDVVGGRRFLDEWLKVHPDDSVALGVAMSFAGYAGDTPGLKGYAQRLEALGKLNATALNNWVWFDVLSGNVNEASLDRIHRAARMESSPGAAQLNTQAAAYAEVGRVRDARDVLVQSIENRWPQGSLSGETWFVIGRIAEQVGCVDAAKEAYSKIRPFNGSYGLSEAIPSVAARRLAALERTKAH